MPKEQKVVFIAEHKWDYYIVPAMSGSTDIEFLLSFWVYCTAVLFHLSE